MPIKSQHFCLPARKSRQARGPIKRGGLISLDLRKHHFKLDKLELIILLSADFYGLAIHSTTILHSRDSHDPMLVAVSKSSAVHSTLNCYPSSTLIFFITIRLFHMAESVYHFIPHFRKFAGFHRPLVNLGRLKECSLACHGHFSRDLMAVATDHYLLSYYTLFSAAKEITTTQDRTTHYIAVDGDRIHY